MSLETLPPELVHALCRLCSREDIYQLRLTSHYIKEVADELMLNRLFVYFDMADFSMAMNLVERNPRVARIVTQLIFQADHLPAASTRQEWNVLRKKTILALAEKRDQLPCTDDPGIEHSPDLETVREERLALERNIIQQETAMCRQYQLRKAFEHYQNLLEDQKKLVDEHQFKSFMNHLFKKCPNLTSVNVESRNLDPRISGPWQVSDPLRSGMVRPWGEPSNGVEPVTEALLEAHEAGAVLSQVTASPISPRFFKQDEHIMSKIYKATRTLSRMSMRIEPDLKDGKMLVTRPPSGDTEVPAPSEQPETMTPQLATTMTLEALGDGRVADFLARFKNLKKLEFTGPLLAPTLPMMPLMDVIGTSPWTDLREISIMRVECTQSELTGVLLKYSRTLKHVMLGDIRLTEGDWRTCFRQLSGCFEGLQYFELIARFSDPHTRGTICIDRDQFTWHQMQFFVMDGAEEPAEWPILPSEVLPF